MFRIEFPFADKALTFEGGLCLDLTLGQGKGLKLRTWRNQHGQGIDSNVKFFFLQLEFSATWGK